MVLAKQATGDGSSWLEVRDVSDGELRRTVTLPGSWHSLSFSGDGKMLAVGGSDCAVRLFRYPDFTPHLPQVGHTMTVCAAAYSADGKHAYSAGADGTLITWDLKTGSPLRSWSLPLSKISTREDVSLFPTPTASCC
jgi:transcription initiation factor TFIID subunit 5